ncbi:MAG: sensor histidine kinase N-terminal domain-containing protein [Rhodocyclales bacterium]|nr:sensor histidine kinase N-terminal domain-containing protein [Rhodocyclales bacterium]
MIEHRRLSLSQRLLVALLIVSFAYWAVIAWLTVRDTINDVYELFDAHLAQTGLALLRVTDPDDTDPTVIPSSIESLALLEIFAPWLDLSARPDKARSADAAQDGHSARPAPIAAGATGLGAIHSLHEEYERRLRYQIWNSEGNLLLRSANAPAVAMTMQDGFSEMTDGEGQVWRLYGVWDQHRNFRILVAEAHDLRTRLVRNIALHLASPLALGMPVLIFLLWFSVSHGLDPLGVLTREIATRKPESLTPLDAASAPGEVRPMVMALNDLLLRMTSTLESERRFTANAAHELRTPLAAIQAQLHAARAAEGEAERLRAMDQLQRGVERGMRLVGQLLTLARIDPEQALPEVRAVDLGAVAETVCAELAPLALQRDQALELAVAPGLPPLPGNADMLAMLLANLVDNAIRYTQRGGHIAIDVRRCDVADGLRIDVGDDGPGVPAAQRERVFDRFYRLAAQDQPGTGLGLAICRRIAELHGARVELADGPGGRGLTASVCLPAATPAAAPAS